MHWIFGDYSKGDPRTFRDAMQREGAEIRRLLASRGVGYDQLKSALVPTQEGMQVAFLYDWWEHPGWNYAVAFAEQYLPHLRPTLRTSVFQGDTHAVRGGIPIDALEDSLVRPRPQQVNWNTQFGVYFNNLRPGDVETLHAALTPDPRYSGYLDATYAGRVRNFLAATLPSMWIIHDRKVILSHGGDEPFVGSEDPVGFDLPEFGYEVVSLVDSYFEAFLSYKIEAEDADQAVDDRILSLAAITGQIVDVEDVDVVVPSDKLDRYLLRDENKLRLMTSIGLQDVTADELGEIVRTKLLQSYIYDFRFAPDGTPLFAVAAEFEKPDGSTARRLLALKHDHASSRISLVSMY
jgi:hypothetical protein